MNSADSRNMRFGEKYVQGGKKPLPGKRNLSEKNGGYDIMKKTRSNAL